MKELLKNRFLVKSNSYIIDLKKVDFITFKENENEIGTYWIKFHIGDKEARFVCYNIMDLQNIMESWTACLDEPIGIEEQILV